MSANEDAEHLRLLAIFHYVYGGMVALFSCLPIFHLGFGIAMAAGAFEEVGNRHQPPPREIGYVIIAFAGLMMAFGYTMAIAIALAGRCIATRTWHTYIFVIAVFECLMMPIGTALGIFTIIVLSKPDVKARFEAVRAGWSELKQPLAPEQRF